jgi:molybdopterin-guanine dinucleotide biosynthesis protein B
MPKLEIYRAANGKPLLHPDDPRIVAIAADVAIETKLPRFALDDYDPIADFILAYNGFK